LKLWLALRFTLCMVWLSLMGCAHAATAPPIAVFSGDGSPPKMFVHEGQQRGVLIDILNYAAQKMPQHRFELNLYPWARAYMASASGQGGLLGISWTQRRDEVFDYSEPLFVDEVVIVVRKGHEFNYRGLSDLKGKTVGTVRGASFGSAFDRAHQDGVFSIDGDNGARNRLQKLEAGRIDCALFNVGKTGFQETLRLNKVPESQWKNYVVLPVPLRRDPNYLAFPKTMRMSEWLLDFNEVIRQGYARGDIQKIIERNLHASR
jgi:polar amino acid transport system substrate-binding protein